MFLARVVGYFLAGVESTSVPFHVGEYMTMSVTPVVENPSRNESSSFSVGTPERRLAGVQNLCYSFRFGAVATLSRNIFRRLHEGLEELDLRPDTIMESCHGSKSY